MIIDEIKKANIVAMKEKDNIAKGILSVVYSEYKYLELENKFKNKEIGDAETVAILQKTLKELDESIVNYKKVNNDAKVQEMQKQIEIINAFLPKMLSADEIRAEIAGLADKSIGNIMKHFKSNFAGKCNMQTVNEVAREFK